MLRLIQDGARPFQNQVLESLIRRELVVQCFYMSWGHYQLTDKGRQQLDIYTPETEPTVVEKQANPDYELVITLRNLATGAAETTTYPRVANFRIDHLRQPRQVSEAYLTYEDRMPFRVRTDNPTGILMSFAEVEGWRVQIEKSEDQSGN